MRQPAAEALLAEVLPAGVVRAQAQRWVAQPAPVWLAPHTDALAQEVPVALVFNGISHAVMMASPTDLEDFALGFALTEGLIDTPAQLYDVVLRAHPQGIELQLNVAAACAWRLKERRRTLAGRTGCGLCGTDSLDQVHRTLPAVPTLHISASAVLRAEASLRGQQRLQQLSGATHAAAFANAEGQIICLREDVGRHNALDKLVGALLRQGSDPQSGFVLVTSRASFEMVQKTVALGASVLAAVSAPTQLAVQCARDANLCLAGFVRGDSLVAYSFAERLQLESGEL